MEIELPSNMDWGGKQFRVNAGTQGEGTNTIDKLQSGGLNVAYSNFIQFYECCYALACCCRISLKSLRAIVCEYSATV